MRALGLGTGAALMALDCSTHFATAQAAIDKVASDMNADIPWNRPEDKELVLALLDDANSRLASAKRNHETAQGDYDHARDIAMADLRKRFALVLQDIHLFPGDVKSNISLESDTISEEQLFEAARTVEAEAFISKLPDGYDTKVSEKGSNFSRGERQLMSFARALAVDPDLLILDEATSSVDPETERTIQGSLKKLMQGRTSLIIAHRLSTILDVDEILVIRRGEIIERGTHIELILQGGYYAKLFHLQFKHRNGVLTNVR